MGWKSTKEMRRSKAIDLIENRLDLATNDQLGYALEALGFGDETHLPYYGCNFSVEDDKHFEQNDDDDDDDNEIDFRL